MRVNKTIICAVAAAVVMIAAAALFALEPWAARAAHVAVEPKESLASYSWAELSSIAAEVSACEDESAATRVAARYGLCAEDGALAGRPAKTVALSDGTELSVRLAGIWRDERTSGGRAGLTFVFADAAAAHAMNHENDASDAPADSTGGWAASDMRSWLAAEFFYLLPQDLRAAITPVQKRTVSRADARVESDAAGELSGFAADLPDQTSDALWLFSASELCGRVPVDDAVGITESIAAAYAAEGEQYRLFADAGVAAFAPNAALVRADRRASATWWLRTKTLEFGDGFWLVGTDGAPLAGLGEDARAADASYVPGNLWGPSHPRAVIAGFCL